ncbi:MAG: patatin-like phospholipase family protein [Arcobacter sp.]|jgi:predicted acylesterase/phospholipase RssA|uniref:patatin-like phospholipase family protein n=1 Tax=Arcobacter sp. TaxID=1872629 RepID=UPI002A7580B5|nr:patatin-like phospholipase family protein [Arcobacter sp.]MDY3205527.1 patatin-like phospholipase family protein [Arcobacter sp.]
MNNQLDIKIKQLRKENNYKEARIIIDKHLEKNPNDFKYKRILAQLIYQDKELSFMYIIDESMRILNTIDVNLDDDYQETWCLKGAIKKREWERFHKIDDLLIAIEYYKKGIGKQFRDSYLNKDETLKNKGYAVVNYLSLIFVLTHNLSKSSFNYLKEINTELIAINCLNILNEIDEEKKDYWYYMTLSDLYFFTKNYDEQKKCIKLALDKLEKDDTKSLDNKNRQKDRSFQQIVLTSNCMPDLNKNILKEILNLFVKQDSFDIDSIVKGKVGLALSGGGFRASFFHIGVLARLAELDILRTIETISTVSGGSIIGMYYYLKLKKLLEEKTDAEITKQDYINIVQELEKEFLEGVQTNIRNRTFCNIFYNIKVAFGDLYNFSRTNVLGEYYQKQFYDNVKFIDKTGKEVSIRYMKQLQIIPKNEDDKFHPYHDNVWRMNKVPNLIVNATNLNSGHSWIFTASGMGEFETMSDINVDKNKIYTYERYENFKDKSLNNIRISDAVAASSAVPALFDPITLPNNFLKEKIKLVDGGVYDNQGIQALTNDNCVSIICSDASGYFKNEENPSSNRFSIMSRMTDNMMDVIRNFQYSNLIEKEKVNLINNLKYIHLKDEIPIYQVNFKDELQKTVGKERCSTTCYDINIDVQQKLALIRTDLDAFNDVEANSLMCSGYLITKNKFMNEKNEDESYKGTFLKIKQLLSLEEKSNEKRNLLGEILSISSEKFFKYIRLKKKVFDRLIYISFTSIVMMELGLFVSGKDSFVVKNVWNLISNNINSIGWILMGLLIIGIFSRRFRLINFVANLLIIPLGLILLLNKVTFEKLFLKFGSYDKFIDSTDYENE